MLPAPPRATALVPHGGVVERLVVPLIRAQAKRRLRREAAAFDGAPRLQIVPPWARPGPGGQTFRAFVQVNLLPRAR